MPIVSHGLGQLDAEIKSAVGKPGPEAVHVAYRLREDSTGEPSIFFRIVLADSAFGEESLTEITGSIATSLIDDRELGSVPLFQFSAPVGASEPQRS